MLVAALSFASNLLICGAFTYMGRAHAKERTFLINTALARTPAEFAVRQQLTTQVADPREQDIEYVEQPVGL